MERPAGAPTEGASRRARNRPRADAQRSIAAILDAALVCFSRNPDVSMAAIARAAGVGRVTLYAHFPSRDALLDAASARALAQAEAAIDAQLLDRLPARQALVRLIRSSWRSISAFGSLVTAMERGLGSERMRHHHRTALARIERLIGRGQAEAAFRTDLPRDWLVTTFYTLLHSAAREVDAGRLRADVAPEVVAATLVAALQPQPVGGAGLPEPPA